MMKKFVHGLMAGLTPSQIAIVIGILCFTAIGAFIAVMVFRKRNQKRANS